MPEPDAFCACGILVNLLRNRAKQVEDCSGLHEMKGRQRRQAATDFNFCPKKETTEIVTRS